MTDLRALIARAEAAEAEVARLREEARRGQEPLARLVLDATTIRRAHKIARAALLAEDGAAHEAPLGSDDMYPESAGSLAALLAQVERLETIHAEGRRRDVIGRFWTRRCHGCANTDPHDAHLTWFGRFYFRFLAGRRW